MSAQDPRSREAVRIDALLLGTPVRARSRRTGAGDWAAYLASGDATRRGETVALAAHGEAGRNLPTPFAARA